VRIVQLANFVTPASGGIRTALRRLASGYRAAGHDVVLVIPGPRAARWREGPWDVVQLAAPRLPRSGGYRIVTDRRRLLHELGRLAPDAVEVSDRLSLLPVGPWAAGCGVPALAIVHERADALLPLQLPGPLLARRAAERNARALAEAFPTLVCASSWGQSEFTRLGLGHTVRVPLGVDLTTFSPARRHPDVQERLRAGAELALVCVSRLSREKRVEVAVATVDRLRNRGVRAHLTVVGEGPERGFLVRRASGLPITFLGHISDRRAVAEVLASADVMLAPGPVESFGLAPLEALASGTPVVAPTTGAVRELLRAPGSGEVAFSHPRSTAAAVLRLLTLDADARRRAARTAAEGFCWSTAVRRMLVLHGGGRRPEEVPSSRHVRGSGQQGVSSTLPRAGARQR
jgi:alpha-1,6-mannosyltransferase